MMNKISIVGIILSVITFFLILFFLVLDLSSGESNPYTGIFTYMVLPGFLSLGISQVAEHLERWLEPLVFPLTRGEEVEQVDAFLPYLWNKHTTPGREVVCLVWSLSLICNIENSCLVSL